MGIVLLPIYAIAFRIIIYCTRHLIKWKRANNLNLFVVLIGIFLSCLIYGGIMYSYSLEKEAWGLSPAFRIPIFMICVPGLIGFFLLKIKLEPQQNMTKVIFTSIVFSAIALLALSAYGFDILDYLNIK